MDLLKEELSSATLAALQAHLDSQKAAEKEGEDKENVLKEDFRKSQFWYDEKTSDTLAKEAYRKAHGGPIAFVSSPAPFHQFLKLYPDYENVYLFEYDHRFEQQYADKFVYYDYNEPVTVPAKYQKYFDFVLVDPPYLNPNCMKQFAKTMRFISKDVTEAGTINTPNILMTAQVLQDMILSELKGFQVLSFKPSFKSKLGNQFNTYTNFTSALLGPVEEL